MGEELDLPDEVYGFGSWLLWLLATRATAVVDEAFAAGPARPSRHYGMVDGHPVPTPSLVAWLITAAEYGVPPDGLARRVRRQDERQKVLRTIVSRAIGGESRLFKDGWLRGLAAVCGLGEPEVQLLVRCRGEEGYPVDPAALRTAIARTLQARPTSGDHGSVGEAAVATRTLPRDITSFTGREPELAQLAGTSGGAGSGGVVGIYAVGGMAGVGKTAFAVHAAHQLAPRFPAGQIFLPLHGHTPGQAPVDPAAALASLLLSIGVPAGQIPPGLEARMALWRDRVADKQLLLLLDDAAASEQVRPLLPGTAGSLVLVTSRRHLTALEDAQLVSLDTLTAEEAAKLLVRLSARPGVDSGDPAIAEITRLCGGLPLAVGMMARQLHHHPAWTPDGLATELAAARDRLELMHAEDLSVAAAFDLSYADLTQDQKRLFRHLGLHPGTDIDGYTAAALDGISLAAACRHLGVLYDQYLIAEPARGRYRLHDLIREHARSKAATDPLAERNAAVGRLLDYYQHTANIAQALLARQSRPGPGLAAVTSPPAATPDLPGRTRALAWVRAERANLLACLDQASATSQHDRTVALTAAIAALLRQDGPWSDAISRHDTAIQAARSLGDRLGEANALNDLGDIRHLTGDYRGAVEALEEALGIYRDLGDRLGQANALNYLGVVQYFTDGFTSARQLLEEALGIYRALGDRLGQANALNYLGAVLPQTANYADAAEALKEALGIYRDLDDRQGQANALNRLGTVRHMIGDYPGAVDALEGALGIYRDLGDRLGQANALNYLGNVRRQTGNYTGAVDAQEEALGIYRDLGDRLGQANALNYLGAVRHIIGDYPGATNAQEEALAIFRDLGQRLGQANALAYLGVVRRLTGDNPGAIEALEEALGIFRDIGDRGAEAEVLNEVGTLYRTRGDVERAGTIHRQALALARKIDSSWDEAQALAGLGRCALAAGRTADAEDNLRKAQEIFQRIGAAEAVGVAAELDVLTEATPAVPKSTDFLR